MEQKKLFQLLSSFYKTINKSLSQLECSPFGKELNRNITFNIEYIEFLFNRKFIPIHFQSNDHDSIRFKYSLFHICPLTDRHQLLYVYSNLGNITHYIRYGKHHNDIINVSILKDLNSSIERTSRASMLKIKNFYIWIIENNIYLNDDLSLFIEKNIFNKL